MANGKAQGPKLPKIAGARPRMPKLPSMPAAPAVGGGMRPPTVRAPALRVTIPTRRRP
jgi:hypothetical protein